MEATKKKRKKKKEPRRPPKRKRKKGAALLSFIPHLCLKNEHPYFSFESFHVLISITMWGTFHYRTWLVYSKDEPPQKCSTSSWASKLDAPPTSSIGELYTLVALCASMLCGNPYSLHSFDCKAFSCLAVTFSALQAFLPFDLPNPDLCSFCHNIMVPNQIHAHRLS